MERVYKTMKNAGAFSIAMGIVAALIGIVVGVGSIVSGAFLLKRKADITF